MKSATSAPLSVDGPLDMEVLRQFRVIFKSVRKHFQSIEELLGISGSLLWAMAVISESPGIRVTALAHAMSIHQSTASNIVAKLVELGLICKERTGADCRVTGLRVTAAGEQQLRRAPAPVRGLLPDALEKLPEGSLRELHRGLQALLAQMEMLEARGCETPLADI